MRQILLLFLLTLSISCNNSNKKAENIKNEKDTPSAVISKNDKDSPDKEKLVIPGQSLGKITLNEDATPLIDRLGQPDSGDAAMGKAVMVWDDFEGNLLTLYTTRQMGVEEFSRIKAIRSLSSEYKTEDNLGVNTPLSELKRYYRLDYAGKFAFEGKHYILYSTPKGIAFEVGMNQKCHGVLIYPVSSSPEETYLPIYSDFDFKK